MQNTRPQAASAKAKQIQPHTLGKDIQQTSQIRFELLDQETNKLIDLFGSLVEASKVRTMNDDDIGEKKRQKKKDRKGRGRDKKSEAIDLEDVTVDKKTENEKDALQIAVCSSEIVHSCETLLQLTAELKRQYLLFDFERLNSSREDKAKQYRRKANRTKENETFNATSVDNIF
ncbi:mediator of RNA polymerase II transcription subunit 22 [Acrasis kona]|uniref:Mediator of RNA polymerase II transcription subunit 22 n=1 Tax=Acrasis kona TaxID=1008807 RepID=A0AAW2YYU3_9EUKA